MSDWQASEARPLAVEVLGERYRRYRLADPAAEEAMARSLQRYGQIAPVVVCVHDGGMEVVDGFKRLAAARLLLPRWTTLSVRVLAVDERGAKAAIYGLNRVSHSTRELEEAWIVHALVREDGLSQVEAASLLGRHKSWICRRLALLERLSPEAKEDLRLGLLSVSVARQLVRLPAGNQAEVLHMTRREALNAAEVRGAVDLLLTSVSREQEEYVLSKPREALQQAHGGTPRAHDPRLSVAGNRVRRRVVVLLDELERLEHWLLHRGRAELTPSDRDWLTPSFTRLLRDAVVVAELVEDLLKEMQTP
jgi:ParB-like chromosome segregation protein Spo0J